MADLWMLLIFGVIGIFMKRFGWSRPAFLIGFVLATQAESYLNMSIQFYGWEMFLRPGVLIILLLTLISVYFSRGGSVDENSELMETQARQRGKIWPQLLFCGFVLLFIVIAIVDARSQSFLGGVFPLTIALVSLPFALWLIWLFVRKKTDDPALFDAEQAVDEGTFKAPWYEPILWVGGLYVLTSFIGFVPAMMFFLISFLTVKANTGWLKTALLTAGGISVLLLFGYFLNLSFPQGLLL